MAPSASAKDLIGSFPDVLGARDLRALASHVARAHQSGRGVAVAMGGHVVKTGCSPVVLDLVQVHPLRLRHRANISRR